MRQYRGGIMQQVRFILSETFLGWAVFVLPKQEPARLALLEFICRYLKIHCQPPSAKK